MKIAVAQVLLRALRGIRTFVVSDADQGGQVKQQLVSVEGILVDAKEEFPPKPRQHPDS